MNWSQIFLRILIENKYSYYCLINRYNIKHIQWSKPANHLRHLSQILMYVFSLVKRIAINSLFDEFSTTLWFPLSPAPFSSLLNQNQHLCYFLWPRDSLLAFIYLNKLVWGLLRIQLLCSWSRASELHEQSCIFIWMHKWVALSSWLLIKFDCVVAVTLVRSARFWSQLK